MSEMVQAGGLPVGSEPYAIGNERAFEPEQVIYVMTRFLAGVCDGAIARDDVGFNGAHSRFGRAMAQTPWDRWSPRQKWAMRRILETYKNTQLAHGWTFIPDIPEPTDEPPIFSFEQGRYIDAPRAPVRTWRRLGYVADAGRFISSMRGMAAIVFEQNYDPTVIAAIKEIPGRQYSGHPDKVWVVPLSSNGISQALDLACEYGYDIPDAVHDIVQTKVVDAGERIARSHASDTDFDVEGLPDGLRLYPFQRAGVEFLVKTKNGLCGDDMGLGKTPQALATLKVTNAYPALVICPASLKDNWAREAQRWTPERSVRVITSKSMMMNDEGKPFADITIMNYDILKRFDGELGIIKWAAIICDEAHKLKGEASQRHKLVRAVMSMNQSARVIFLTGTPVVNKPMEFWSLIKLLGYGPQFGGEKAFKYRYDTYYRDRLEELNQRAREMFMVRRTKIQVLSDLPDKMRTVVPIEIDNRDHYDDVEGDLAAYMARIAVSKGTFDPAQAIQDVLRLQLSPAEAGEYLANAQKHWEGAVYSGKFDMVSRNEQLLRWGQLKKLAVEGKMRAAMDWLDEFLDDTEEKIVVFVWHVEIGERIAKRYSADFIHGAMPVPHRQPAVDRFTDDPSRRVLVGNIQAAGEGLNLQVASNVCFLEYGWNPKDHQQAEDRCHRIGQKSSVTAWYLAGKDTIEDEIAALIARKLEVTTAIQDGAGKDVQMEMINELYQKLQSRRR